MWSQRSVWTSHVGQWNQKRSKKQKNKPQNIFLFKSVKSVSFYDQTQMRAQLFDFCLTGFKRQGQFPRDCQCPRRYQCRTGCLIRTKLCWHFICLFVCSLSGQKLSSSRRTHWRCTKTVGGKRAVCSRPSQIQCIVSFVWPGEVTLEVFPVHIYLYMIPIPLNCTCMSPSSEMKKPKVVRRTSLRPPAAEFSADRTWHP